MKLQFKNNCILSCIVTLSNERNKCINFTHWKDNFWKDSLYETSSREPTAGVGMDLEHSRIQTSSTINRSEFKSNHGG